MRPRENERELELSKQGDEKTVRGIEKTKGKGAREIEKNEMGG